MIPHHPGLLELLPHEEQPPQLLVVHNDGFGQMLCEPFNLGRAIFCRVLK